MTLLFEAKSAFDGRGHTYDVSADGKQFVVVESVGEASPLAIRIVENWYEERRDLSGTKPLKPTT